MRDAKFTAGQTVFASADMKHGVVRVGGEIAIVEAYPDGDYVPMYLARRWNGDAFYALENELSARVPREAYDAAE